MEWYVLATHETTTLMVVLYQIEYGKTQCNASGHTHPVTLDRCEWKVREGQGDVESYGMRER